MACDPRYTTQAVPSKLVISGISARFRGLSMVLGPERISIPVTLDT